MSGSPRRGGSRERRVLARRSFAAGDAAPDGRARRVRRGRRLRVGRGSTRRHSSKHRKAPPGRHACTVGTDYRAADLPRTGGRVACGPQLGARLDAWSEPGMCFASYAHRFKAITSLTASPRSSFALELVARDGPDRLDPEGGPRVGLIRSRGADRVVGHGWLRSFALTLRPGGRRCEASRPATPRREPPARRARRGPSGCHPGRSARRRRRRGARAGA